MSRRRRPRRPPRIAPFARRFAVAAALVGAARLALPYALGEYVERVFAEVEEYELDLDSIDVGLWRGAYQLDGLELRQLVDGEPRPLLEVGRVDLSVRWRWLMRGALVGEVVLHRPVLNQYELADDARGSAPIDEELEEDELGELQEDEYVVEWWAIVEALFPFRIDRLAVRDGELRYRDETLDPPVDLFVSDLWIELLNLTNIRAERGVLLAQLEAAGRPMGSGEGELRVLFDPSVERTRLELRAELRRVSLPELNDALEAYASLDVERGELSIYTEMAVRGERIEGYARTLIEHLEVVRWGEIDSPGDALEALWEGLVGLAAEVLENQPHDRLATRVPIEGRVEDVRTSTGALIATMLRNAFVQALAPALEGSIGLEDVDRAAGAGERSERAERGARRGPP